MRKFINSLVSVLIGGILLPVMCHAFISSTTLGQPITTTTTLATAAECITVIETPRIVSSLQSETDHQAQTPLGLSRLFIAPKSAPIKHIGKLDDLNGIPRSQTLLDDLPNLGSPKANYYQNNSVLRKALHDGYQIKDASVFRLNTSPDPTLLWPDRTVGQSFLGAERLIMGNKGFVPNSSGLYVPR